MAASEARVSTLCRRCGLCCNGALFESAPIGADERIPAAAVRLRVLEDRHALLQPCAAHGDEGCRIYADRPKACRTYDCMLATALREDEVSLAEAMDLVAAALTHVAEARAALAPGQNSTLALWRQVMNAKEAAPDAHWPEAYVLHMKRVFLGRS